MIPIKVIVLVLSLVICAVNSRNSKSKSDNCCVDNEENCCPCFPSKEVQEHYDNLLLQLPTVSTKKYCKIAKQDLKVVDDYQKKCDHEQFKGVMKNVVDGFTKYLKTYCNDHHNDPSCDQAEEADEAAKGCADRFVNSVYYIMKNIPAKDQIALYYCSRDIREKCIFDEVNKICGKKYARFVMDRHSTPVQQYVSTTIGPQSSKVCQNYPKEMKDIARINKYSKTSGRSLLYVVYKSHTNTFDSECYTYD